MQSHHAIYQLKESASFCSEKKKSLEKFNFTVAIWHFQFYHCIIIFFWGNAQSSRWSHAFVIILLKENAYGICIKWKPIELILWSFYQKMLSIDRWQWSNNRAINLCAKTKWTIMWSYITLKRARTSPYIFIISKKKQWSSKYWEISIFCAKHTFRIIDSPKIKSKIILFCFDFLHQRARVNFSQFTSQSNPRHQFECVLFLLGLSHSGNLLHCALSTDDGPRRTKN